MRAIRAARKFIESNPGDPSANTLAQLVLALANETPFNVSELYQLDPKNFELAIAILTDWRLDRYYMGKAKLFDLSWQIKQMQEA